MTKFHVLPFRQDMPAISVKKPKQTNTPDLSPISCVYGSSYHGKCFHN